jgi:arylsulfatase A-like enzyme
MEAAGFKTALFSANPHASPIYGIGLGFGEAYYGPGLKTFTQNGEEHFAPAILLRAFDRWLTQNPKSRSFIYLHFIPPHVPYEQPEEYTGRYRDQTPPDFVAANYTPNKFLFPIKVKGHKRESPPLPEWINLYDANLRYGDWAIGEVKRLLEKHGLYDQTLLILTSDHGDGFGEHGFPWHHGGIYPEVTNIPLVMRLPGGGAGGKNINALTETIDLLPTVYDLVQAPFPGGEVQGKSLLPLMTGQQAKVRDYSFTRSDHPAKYMVRDLRHSFLLYTNPQWQALYDTASDPGYRKNVIGEQPQAADKLHKIFLQFADEQRYSPAEFPGVTAKAAPQRAAGKKAKLSPEIEREMKALGYLK